LPARLPRNLAGGGRRVYFETTERLLPADINDRFDVYEWSDPAVDLNGSLRLVSAGVGAQDSQFLDASASGEDVFFTTVDRLVARDTDAQFDLYDARVNGGLPEPSALPACKGDACQDSPPAAVPAAPAGTASFNGAGNQKEKRKHKKRRHHKGKQKGSKKGGSGKARNAGKRGRGSR
jgi:hypothetical protein